MTQQIFSPKFGILKFDGKEFKYLTKVAGKEPYSYNFNFNGQDYVWVPESVINNGIITNEITGADGKIIGGNQYFFPNLMNKDTIKKLFENGEGLDLAGTKYENSIVKNKNSTKGILVPANKWKELRIDSKLNYYVIDENTMGDGPILGIGENPEHPNEYTYFTRPQGGGSSAWIFTDEQGGLIRRTRYYTVKKKGGVLGSAIRSVSNAVAGVPLLPELAFIASGGNPLVYASLKGAQTIGQGGSPSDVFKATATAYISADLSTNPYVQSVGGSIVSATTLANLGLQPATIALVQNAIGGAVVNAAYSGVMAGLTGGDIEKSMLAGAVGGAIGATGKEFASAIVGGSENLAEIAKTLKITTDEAAYILSGSFADSINASLRGADFFTAFKNELVSKGVGVKTGDLVENTIKTKIGENYMRQIVDASQQVSTIAAKASLEGRDVGKTVEEAMPGILVSTFKAEREREKESKRIKEQKLVEEQKQVEDQKRAEQENILISQIQEAAQREFGPATSEIELAQYSGDTPRINISGVLPLIYVGDTVTINDAGVIFDKASGVSVGQLNESELLALRERLGLPKNTGNLITDVNISGGTSGEIGSTIGDGGAAEGPSGLPTDVQFENPEVLDLMAQQQFFRDQINQIGVETNRLGNLREELQAGLNQVSPASQTQIQNQIDQITNEINRLNDIATIATENEATAKENLTILENQLQERTASETERAFGRIERQTAAEQRRFEQEQANFEKELESLEKDLEKADSEKEILKSRQQFVAEQRKKLSQTNRLTGTLQEQFDAEINDLLDQYEAAQERASTSATQIEGLVAPQQIRPGGQGISDEEVIRFLGLDEGEASRYGFEFGRGEGGDAGGGQRFEEPTIAPEEQPEGEFGLGPNEGEGEGLGEGEAEGEDVELKPIRVRPVVIGEPRTRTVGEVTQTISPRVTGEALEGILGEKEPLFGGDEDDQRAVWNRRSLRLRKALGL